MNTYHYGEHGRASAVTYLGEAECVNYQIDYDHHPAKYRDALKEVCLVVEI